MSIVCIIPARGGSKRIPGKNLMPIAGRPALAWSLIHARQAKLVDDVVVTTDDQGIAALARAYGAKVVVRPDDISHDAATSESALLHALDARKAEGHDEPELVVFLQCTSPVRRLHDIDNAIQTYRDERADSVFSVCENSRLIWALPDDEPVAINYSWKNRRREQEMERQVRENGSIYVFPPDLLRQTNNRMGGRKRVYQMDYWTSFQLDTEEHFELLDWILRRPEYTIPSPWPAPVDLLVFDFDGVMTDNSAFVDETGRETVRVSRSDGLGIDRIRDLGVPMMILSTERNPVVAARADKLQIEVEHGVEDKAKRLAEILNTRGYDAERVIYVGNDTNDLGCFALVGFPVAVADAQPEVRANACHVLSKNGGHGAVRELCDALTWNFSKSKERQP